MGATNLVPDDDALDMLDDEYGDMFEKFSQKERVKVSKRTKKDEIRDKRREREGERESLLANDTITVIR